MSLDTIPPDPPTIYKSTPGDEYPYDDERRAEVQAFLTGENAWGEAFGEWAAKTNLTADDPATLALLALVPEFDFYWNPDSGRVEYDAPTIPGDWADGDYSAWIDSWSTAAAVDEELGDLGRTVADTLDTYYVD